jgi:hypothetical protein
MAGKAEIEALHFQRPQVQAIHPNVYAALPG